MKNPKLVLISLFLAFAMISNAQTESGKVLLGTTVNLTGSQIGLIAPQSNGIGVSFGTVTNTYGNEEEKTKLKIFNFSPHAGYFFANNFIGGVSANILKYSEKEEDNNGSEFSYTVFQAGPFFRYYFNTEKVNPYLHTSASFGSFSFDDSDEKTNIMEIGGGVGLAVFLNDFVSLDFLVGYSYFRMKEDDNTSGFDSESSLGNFALDIGFSALIGGNDKEE